MSERSSAAPDRALKTDGDLPALPEAAPSRRTRGPRRDARRRPHPRLDQVRRTWYFFRRNTLAMVGLGIVAFFVFAFIYGVSLPVNNQQLDLWCATGGVSSTCPGGPHTVCTYPQGTTPPSPGCYVVPVVAGEPYSNFVAPTITLNPPSLGPVPFGAFVAGGQVGTPYFENLFDGLAKGSMWSISIAITIVSIGAVSGTILGSLSGFYGGLLDEGLMRATDIFFSIPGILLVIVVIIAGVELGLTGFNDRILLMISAFAMTSWPIYARIVRGQSLVVREQKYVEAARAAGATNGRLLRKHVLPNSVYPVFVQMSLDVGAFPLNVAALIFIGFPIVPNVLWPEWGSIAAQATVVLPSILLTCNILGSGSTCPLPWWQALFPGLALFLFAISVSFVADGLRDAFDPRLRR